MKKKNTTQQPHGGTVRRPSRLGTGHERRQALSAAYERWVTLLKDENATAAEIAAAHAAFRAVPDVLPTTPNLAYPIVEALERQICLLAPQDPWIPEVVVGAGQRYPFPAAVDIEDIAFLATLDWHYDPFPNAGELIVEALQRSAYALGYVWSNADQAFVPRTQVPDAG